ncbi:MAG: endonuclease V [Pirellulaceae bacterium]|nr:endonuclease V [Pirellulaceae bacterium]
MIACVDVDYRDAGAVAACVCFEQWDDSTPVLESAIEIRDVEPYEPSRFYRRELPCILAVLQTLPTLPQTVVIDGYVWLGEQRRGLGAHLYEALDKRAAIVGVAKTRFAGAEPVALVTRGQSRTPLYVTATGMDVAEAARHIRMMHGSHRIPTMLKRVDQLGRGYLRADSRGEADT